MPDPTPGPRDVVVEVAACGLCGTDLHIIQGEFAPTLPVVPGHEFAGTVAEVGSAVTELRVGDRVAVDPSLHCHECRYCRAGRGNLCERWAAIGVTTAGGAAARHLGVSASAASPDALDRPSGWDVVIDATGNAAAIQDGLGRVAKAGTFLQFGVADYATRVTIDPYRIYNQEITITGSMAVLHSYERAAELFATGVLDPDVFISDRLPLDDYPQALDRFASGQGRKIVVTP
ncbi:alcohol dehydrogenase catalytic domain-containing protein [Streptomyces sp. NPDC050095]|uniref:alcohol dehydrogenase catalytic domain-containing protein n=1 Tax=unclassified Streptomyces TaxID=2593676 RepID=UPI003432CC03